MAASVEKVVDALISFLGRICNPAADELGLIIADQFKHWRRRNLARLVQNTKRILEERKAKKPDLSDQQAHPWVMYEVIEKGSLCDDDYLQELWGGLLAAACGPDGGDDGDLVYTNLLNQLPGVSAKLLKLVCEVPTQQEIPNVDYPYRYTSSVRVADLTLQLGCDDHNRVVREIEHLYAIGLIHNPMLHLVFVNPNREFFADLSATPLGQNLYVRCQGFRGTPTEY